MTQNSEETIHKLAYHDKLRVANSVFDSKTPMLFTHNVVANFDGLKENNVGNCIQAIKKIQTLAKVPKTQDHKEVRNSERRDYKSREFTLSQGWDRDIIPRYFNIIPV